MPQESQTYIPRMGIRSPLPLMLVSLTACDCTRDASATLFPDETAAPTSCGAPVSPGAAQIYPTSPDGVPLGDVMLYYDLATSRHIVFYLKDLWDDATNTRHPWFALSTTDLVRYEPVTDRELLGSSSDPCAQDFALGTGNVVRKEDTFFAFYTGHNPNAPSACAPRREGVMLATTTNLDAGFSRFQAFSTIYPPLGQGFEETNNFRDPQVFQDPASGLYHMSVAARKSVNGQLRGVIVKYTSNDLMNWSGPEVLYDGDDMLYFMLETPQMSRIGAFYYLTFSDIDSKLVFYRKSHSPYGPWMKPTGLERFEGTGIYAAKVSTNDLGQQYVFGWTHDLAGHEDTGSPSWAGNLVAHTLNQLPDGDLVVALPPAVRSYLETQGLDPGFHGVRGSAAAGPVPGSYSFDAGPMTGLASAEFRAVSAARYLLSATFEFDERAGDFGVTLGGECDGTENLYTLRFVPDEDKVRFDRQPPSQLTLDTKSVSDVPLALTVDTDYRLDVVVEGSMIVAYVNNQAALSMRAYNAASRCWGLFSTNSTVHVRDVAVHSP